MPLPYRGFAQCARVQDVKTLKALRLRVHMMLDLLADPKNLNDLYNPSVSYWCRARNSLVYYGIQVVKELRRRGYPDKADFWNRYLRFVTPLLPSHVHRPWWIGNRALHASHRTVRPIWPVDADYHDLRTETVLKDRVRILKAKMVDGHYVVDTDTHTYLLETKA